METGKLVASFEANTTKFDAGVRGVQSKLAGIIAQMGQVTGTSNLASSSLTGLSSRLGIVAGGSVIAASATRRYDQFNGRHKGRHSFRGGDS